MPITIPDELELSVEQVATLTGLTESRVRQLAGTMPLPTRDKGQAIRIPADMVDAIRQRGAERRTPLQAAKDRIAELESQVALLQTINEKLNAASGSQPAPTPPTIYAQSVREGRHAEAHYEPALD